MALVCYYGTGVLVNSIIFIPSFLQTRQKVKIKKRPQNTAIYKDTEYINLRAVFFFGEESKLINFSERFMIRIL
jgi:hypothetical protein